MILSPECGERSSSEQNPLERYRGGISRCVRCGSCSAACPVFLHDRRESQSPRGRMALIEAALAGRIAISDLYKDRLSACTGCMACEAQCASGVPVTAIIQAAKEQAVRETGCGIIQTVVAGALKYEDAMRALSWFAPVALHFEKAAVFGKTTEEARRRKQSAEWVARKEEACRGGKKKKVIFYPGCAIRYFQQDIEYATVAVLERLGYEVRMPEGLKCCGRPFLSLGDRETAKRLAEQNARALASPDAEAVVTSCASCGLTFKQEYPKLLAQSGPPSLPVLDIHEFLTDKLHLLDFRPFSSAVTWHDPCHLGRGQGLAATAREVLRGVPGTTLVEMERPDRCCGFGGVMRATQFALFWAIGRSKARDVMQTAAPLVVTGCPGCRMQIADSLSREGARVTVVHTVQVIEAALRDAGRGEGEKRRRGEQVAMSR